MGGTNDTARLERELATAAGATLRDTYKQAGDESEEERPTLARVVRSIAGAERWQASPTEALLYVMQLAISKLPERIELRTDRKTRPPRAALGKPEPLIAALMYGYRQEELPPRFNEDGGKVKRTYKHDFRPAALRAAGFEVTTDDSSAKRLLMAIRQDLADKLLEMENQAIASRPESAASIVAADQTPLDSQTLIIREEYIGVLRGHLEAGKKILCIWGEAGTGKTTLAQHFASLLHGTRPILTLRAGDPKILRFDITDALIVEGLQPTNWSDDYSIATFRKKLGEQMQSKAVVLDSIDDEELIWRLIPSRPCVPVIITMRKQPQNAQIVREQLHDFTEAQAFEFIRFNLQNEREREMRMLAKALGYRPLALEHAALFIRESPNVTILQLVERLAIETVETLTLVTPPELQERNLIRLYALVLASIEGNPAALSLLDRFLAAVGRSGIGIRDLVRSFMASDYGGRFDAIHFYAGQRALTRYGLLRDVRNPGGKVELVMHPLTYRIVRDLRRVIPFELEVRYLNFLLETDHSVSEEEEAGEEDQGPEWRVEAKLRQWEISTMRRALPNGWLSFYAIDQGTWLAVREEPAESGPRQPYAVRYETFPDLNKIYKLDYRTGKRAPLGDDEASAYYFLVQLYWERVRPELERLRAFDANVTSDEMVIGGAALEKAVGRLDGDITPADNYRHVIVDWMLAEDCTALEWGMWSLCGKRFVPLASAPTENCPDCEQMKGSPERFRAIERDMQSFMRNIQIDDPAWTSHLYLIRSFVRNKLKRSQEALTDLGSALYFLRSFDVPRNERLALGEGILRAAKGVHGIAPEELMALCDQLLLPEIPATDPRIIRILCHRSEILIGIGQSSVALGDCESMLSIIGSGEVDVDHKTKSRIWYAKEEAERSLGRSDEANASMRQAIIEAEKTTGDGGHLIATLASLSCVYLVSSNPHLARDDLQNVLRILQSQHIKIYEDIWQCLMLLSQTHWECHEVAAALRAAREAVQVAEKHLPSPTSRHEMSLEAVRQIEAGDYKWGDMRDVLRP